MTALVRYEAARAALEAAVTADEIIRVELTAETLENIGRIAKDFQLELNAYVLRTRAKAKLGHYLDDAESKGLYGKGRPAKMSPAAHFQENFAKAEIPRKLAAESRRLSGIGAQALDQLLTRVEEESAKRGTVARDVLRTKEREDRHAARVRLQQELSDRSEQLACGRKFPVIYADPATRFLSGFGPKSIENHYPTMSMDELCDLPVAQRCMLNCQLFVWSTVPQLANTITLLLPAWGGFKYSSHCMWDKTDPEHEGEIGAGLVFRNQHEVLIYATRGNPPGPRWRPPSIFRERKREHSRKPDYYREMIRRMTEGLPVLELFARVDGAHPLPPGFYAWGNQAEVIDASTGEINPESEVTASRGEERPPAAEVVSQQPVTQNQISDQHRAFVGDPESDPFFIPAFCRRTESKSQSVVCPRESELTNAGRGD